jgi:hypothetical protein
MSTGRAFAEGAPATERATAAAAAPATAEFLARRALLRRVARFSVESIMAFRSFIWD